MPSTKVYPRQRRDWEWHYLKNLFQANLLMSLRRLRPLWTTTFSPDGKLLAYAGEDTNIVLADGTLRRTCCVVSGGTRELFILWPSATTIGAWRASAKPAP